MAAIKKNKYAEKWTKEEVLSVMYKALKSVNEDCYYLSEVCLASGVYPEWISRMLKKFQDDEQVCQAIKKMQLKCESMITRKTGKGDIVPSLGIFILKSYHNLVETSRVEQKVEQEINLKGSIPIEKWLEAVRDDPS